MNGQHFVYFIGGPLDLTKRSFPGYDPPVRRFRFPTMPNGATYHHENEPIRFDGLGEVEYELHGPVPETRDKVWIGVFVT